MPWRASTLLILAIGAYTFSSSPNAIRSSSATVRHRRNLQSADGPCMWQATDSDVTVSVVERGGVEPPGCPQKMGRSGGAEGAVTKRKPPLGRLLERYAGETSRESSLRCPEEPGWLKQRPMRHRHEAVETR